MDKQKEINLNNRINAITGALFDAGVPKPKVISLIAGLYDAVGDYVGDKKYKDEQKCTK